MPSGISSTWCDTRTWTGPSRSVASRLSSPQQRLAATEVETGGRLVEQQQLRVGHQGAGELHPLALALGQRPEPPFDQAASSRPSASRSQARATSQAS